MSVRYITLDAKDYTVHLDESGHPQRIEVGYYGYRGRLVMRDVKRDGPTWRKVVAAQSACKWPQCGCAGTRPEWCTAHASAIAKAEGQQ